ncbi:hypothetical protein [Cardinium endosymbiont of Oedothorax gibbosus]|uniref:hypothetical protein n=1 Tax=Cardinium endosymbiont of Oedothorax gibbosus TaxID=931101 RepID=UPI002023E634|nr:hypothetical protein [Cardinium endosymbiont of Oedothorax gibbosus]
MVWVESNAASPSSLQRLKKGTYDENLAAYRVECCKQPKAVKKVPLVPLVCPLDQTNHLAQRLAQRKVAYAHMGCLKGYTIQLYMGSSRTAALKVQDFVSTFIYPSELRYRQPHYIVKLGFFSDRLEAYFVYLTLLKKIPGAVICPCMYTRQAYLAAMLYPHEAVASNDITDDSLPLG